MTMAHQYTEFNSLVIDIVAQIEQINGYRNRVLKVETVRDLDRVIFEVAEHVGMLQTSLSGLRRKVQLKRAAMDAAEYETPSLGSVPK